MLRFHDFLIKPYLFFALSLCLWSLSSFFPVFPLSLFLFLSFFSDLGGVFPLWRSYSLLEFCKLVLPAVLPASYMFINFMKKQSWFKKKFQYYKTRKEMSVLLLKAVEKNCLRITKYLLVELIDSQAWPRSAQLFNFVILYLSYIWLYHH